jgi:DNA helicase-2/ATP-dependent DNA helicase PcrA
MTRAKDSLHLVVPQRFYPHNQPARGDRHVYASRTRFIPASMLSAFEQSSWASAALKDDPRRKPGVKVDLGARMRGMWK